MTPHPRSAPTRPDRRRRHDDHRLARRRRGRGRRGDRRRLDRVHQVPARRCGEQRIHAGCERLPRRARTSRPRVRRRRPPSPRTTRRRSWRRRVRGRPDHGRGHDHRSQGRQDDPRRAS